MQKSNVTTKILNTYFDRNFDLRVQFFNLLAFIGMAVGIGVAIIGIIMKKPLGNVIIDASISAVSFLLLCIAEKSKSYRLCSWIMVVVVFMIGFPVLFFYCGGHKSGLCCFFVLAIVFTVHMLEKHDRIFAVALELMLYIGCYFYVYYKPEIILFLLPERTYIIDTAVNFIVSGALLLITITIRNRMITARQIQIQELNRELEARNETLAKYDKMKSEFLATIAHEINTPLAIISASSNDTLDLLKESPLNTEEIMENQKIIEKRVRLIDSILLDLMDTVAIENGRLPLTRQSVSLAELLKDVCETQFKKLNVNGNSIAYDFQQDLPQIWLDISRIEQVITNLLSNAVRHTKGGVITVRLMRANNIQTVMIADTGEGMDSAMVQTVFKQYVSTKADYWRHGIGLYICRRIIMAHGGEMWIHSEKGRGTSIFFSLTEDNEHE